MNEAYEAVLELNAIAERNEFPEELHFSYLTDGQTEIIKMGEMTVYHSDLHKYYEKEVDGYLVDVPQPILDFCKNSFIRLKSTLNKLKLK